MSGVAVGPSLADFAPWLNEGFDVALDDARLAMTLAVAEPLAGSARAAGGFRLEFVGPAEPVLPQSIMIVTGPAGQQEIFLVPVARDQTGTRYEAVFY